MCVMPSLSNISMQYTMQFSVRQFPGKILLKLDEYMNPGWYKIRFDIRKKTKNLSYSAYTKVYIEYIWITI